MEIMDGVGTDRWEVRMATEEKQRRKPEEREIWRPEVIWLVKHQIDIKGPRDRDSFRQLFLAFSRFSLSELAPNYSIAGFLFYHINFADHFRFYHMI